MPLQHNRVDLYIAFVIVGLFNNYTLIQKKIQAKEMYYIIYIFSKRQDYEAMRNGKRRLLWRVVCVYVNVVI